MKFKVGDKVTGINDDRYDITTSQAIMEVTKIIGDDMYVKVLEHKTRPTEIGHEFLVDLRFFKLVEEAAPVRSTACPFHAGQKVRHVRIGELDEVVSVPGMPEYDDVGYFDADQGMVLKENDWCYQKYWEPAVGYAATHESVVTDAFTKLEPKKGKLMASLYALTARLKKALNPNLQAFYKLGWIDGDLKITSAGRDQLVEFLLDQNEDAFGKFAQAEVARIEKESKKKE